MLRLLAIAAVLCATAPLAAAQDEPTVEQFARGAVDRARRAVAIGPMIGAGGAYAPSAEHLDVPITFGVGLVLFDIPVVTGPRALEEMIRARVKAKVSARAKAMIAAGAPPPTEQEIAQMAGEVLIEVKAEILGQRPYTGRTLERPRLAVALEGAYLPREGDWQARATFGYGVSRVTIGPTIAGYFGDANGLYLGGELAVHLTPQRGPRTHVIDVFARYDFGVTSAVDGADQIGFGLRLLLDLI